MFFITSKLLAFLTKPITWIFILLILSLILQRRRKRLIYITFFIFYIFTNSFIADSCSRIWEISRFQPQKTYDVGIVLGGISDYDEITKAHNFNKNADRLIEAEQLYRQKVIKKIMISGGNGKIFNNEYLEANAMKNHLLKNKIPSEDILTENRSRNTKENALYSSIILKEKFPNGNFLIITSAKHMRRAQYCFDQTNIKTTAFPTDCTTTHPGKGIEYLFLPRADALEVWESLFHEWIGYLAYRLHFNPASTKRTLISLCNFRASNLALSAKSILLPA